MKKILVALVAIGWSWGAVAGAQPSQACPVLATNDSFLGIKTLPLWPGEAPQAKGNSCDDIPTLTEFDPQLGMATGSAVVIFPGGGYQSLTSPLESREIAD